MEHYYTIWSAVLHYVTQCNTVLHYVTLCNTVLYYVTLCTIITTLYYSYSNGDSHIWSLSTNDASTLTPSPATPTIAKPTCAAISDTLACIGDTEGKPIVAMDTKCHYFVVRDFEIL